MNDQQLRIVVSAKDSASSVIKKIQSQLKDSSSSLSKGLDQATNSAKNMGGGLDLSAKKAALMGAVAGATVAGLSALAHGLKAVGAAAIGGAADYEQQRIAFETMLGSADKARTMMQDIAQFAKATPFELPEVVKGSKQLLAFGVAQEKIIPTMRMLGDIAAGVGVPVGQLAYVFGQVRVAGKLMGGDLMQFTNAGVPMIEGLSKVLKVSQGDVKKMVEAGEVGFDAVEKVLVSMTNEGSKFGGMMEKQSKSFSGVVSNIKDGFGQMLRSAMGVTAGGDIVANGLFDRIKNAAEVAMPAIQRASELAGPAMQSFMEKMDGVAQGAVKVGEQVALYLEPKLRALWSTLSETLIPALLRLWTEVIEPMVPVIGVLLVGALGAAIDVVNGLFSALEPLITFMAKNPAVVYALVGAFVALKGAMMLHSTIVALQAGLGALTTSTIPALVAKVGVLQTALTGFSGFAVVGLAAAAAVVQIVRVFNALNDIKRLNEEISKQQDSHGAGTTAFFESLKTGVAEGRFSQTEANRRMKDYNANFQSFTGRATGGRVSAGQAYTVGENQAETFVPNTSGRIKPSARNADGGGKVTNILSGTFNFSTSEAVEAMWTRLDKTQRLARLGMA